MSDSYSTPSKYLEYKFSSKPFEILSLIPISLNIDFRYKTLKYYFQIRTQRLQIDWCTYF